MRAIVWLIQSIAALIGVVATYLPLYADVSGRKEWWNMAWQYWAMIGVTILWVSMLSIIIRLLWENHKFRSEEGRLKLEKLRMEVDRLKTDQSAMDTGKLI